MTANSPDWDPSTNRFQEQEDAMLDDYDRLCEQLEKRHGFISPIHTVLSTPDWKLDDVLFFTRTQSSGSTPNLMQKHIIPFGKQN